MTKLRDPMSIEQAIQTVVDCIGWSQASSVCGVVERTARYWADADHPTSISMANAEKLDRAFIDAGGDHAPILRAMACRLSAAKRAALENLPPAAVTASRMALSSGRAVAALLEIGANPDARQRRYARKELHEAIDSLTNGLAELDRMEAREKS
jgi:hypothetical protein